MPMKDLMASKNIVLESEKNNGQTFSPERNKDLADQLADWIIQYGLQNSIYMENYHVDFQTIIDETDFTKEWLIENVDLIHESLAEHNDNELLEYNPEESEYNDFNLYFCSNSEEMEENTLFKQNKDGRWVRKTDEELQPR